jgi:outer membrane lipoprotein
MATRTCSSASGWGLSSRRLPVVLLLAAVAILGCAEAQISPQLRGQAVPVDFAELAANPERFLNETVILGGQIINTVPTPEGTLLTILQTKTENLDRPEGPETSKGRFMALYKGFLDPQIYAQGRQVTVAGQVAGKRMAKLGEIEYAYPLIKAEQVYLWPRPEPRVYYAPYGYAPYWPYGPYYYAPYGFYPWGWW